MCECKVQDCLDAATLLTINASHDMRPPTPLYNSEIYHHHHLFVLCMNKTEGRLRNSITQLFPPVPKPLISAIIIIHLNNKCKPRHPCKTFSD